MQALSIERGKPGPGLLAHIMAAKFDDHIPLYRLSGLRLAEIDISRSVMADWTVRVSVLLAPLISLIRAISPRSTECIRTIPRSKFSTLGEERQSRRLWVYVFDCSGYHDPTPGAICLLL